MCTCRQCYKTDIKGSRSQEEGKQPGRKSLCSSGERQCEAGCDTLRSAWRKARQLSTRRCAGGSPRLSTWQPRTCCQNPCCSGSSPGSRTNTSERCQKLATRTLICTTALFVCSCRSDYFYFQLSLSSICIWYQECKDGCRPPGFWYWSEFLYHKWHISSGTQNLSVPQKMFFHYK